MRKNEVENLSISMPSPAGEGGSCRNIPRQLTDEVVPT